jgi:hypothetical protein
MESRRLQHTLTIGLGKAGRASRLLEFGHFFTLLQARAKDVCRDGPMQKRCKGRFELLGGGFLDLCYCTGSQVRCKQ